MDKRVVVVVGECEFLVESGPIPKPTETTGKNTISEGPRSAAAATASVAAAAQ